MVIFYVYCSNQSQVDVFFDNLQVVHTRGPLLEEDSYYPGGLKMTGICSTAGMALENNYTYQGKFSEQSDETGWNEFELRNYDVQTNRWAGSDPKDQFGSGYVGMENNPVNSYDTDGSWSFGLTGAALGAAIGATAAYLITKNNPHMSGIFKGLIDVGLPLLGAGIGYGGFESLSPATTGKDAWANDDHKFFANFRAFYKGLFTRGSTNLGDGKDMVYNGQYNSDKKANVWAETPNISIIPRIEIPRIAVSVTFKFILPNWIIWNRYFKRGENGNPDDEEPDRFNPDNYSLGGRIWRNVLAPNMWDDGPLFWGINFNAWFGVLVFQNPWISPYLIHPTYQLLRHVIVKPVIKIHFYGR